MKYDTKLQLLLSIFLVVIVLMNVLGSKVTQFYGFAFSVSIFLTPLTFLITDLVAEVYGRKISNDFLKFGIVAVLITLGFIALSLYLPPADRYLDNPAFLVVFTSGLRMTLASLVSFVASQAHDIWAFHFWKSVTKGRFLWLRNNLSTMVSQTIDNFLFMYLAFYNPSVGFDFWYVFYMGLPLLVLKIVFALLDTPFVYLGVAWLRKK